MELDTDRAAQQEGICCQIDKPRDVGADDANLRLSQTGGSATESNRANQVGADRSVSGVSIDEFKWMVRLPQYGGPEGWPTREHELTFPSVGRSGVAQGTTGSGQC